MNGISIALAYVGFTVLLLFFVRAAFNAYRAKDDFEEILKNLKSELIHSDDEYSAFTDGHPYTWTETDFDELTQGIRNNISKQWSLYIPFFPKMKCWYHVDNQSRHIYMVPWVSDFDYSELMHYQAWLESEPEVAKNIAKHRQQHS